jgi:tight adherence protein C
MTGSTLLAVGLGALFAAFVLVALTMMAWRPSTQGVSRSLGMIDQMAAGGGVAVVQGGPGERSVPFAGSMRALAARLSPAGFAETTRRRLDIAGNPRGMTPDQLLAIKGLALIGGSVLGLLIGLRHGPLLMLVLAAAFGAAGFFVPDLLVHNAGTKRQEELRRTLPDALDMLTISVEAGLGFDAALSQVAGNTVGPLAGEFFRVLKEMQIGKSRSEAFTDLRGRTTVEELHAFVTALVQADRQGIPVASVLREQSREMRLKRMQRAEEAAAKVPVKILFPLVLCIFPVMFVVIIGPGVIQIVQAFAGRL